MFFAGSLGLDYLSPNAPLGSFILLIGFCFSIIIGYVIYTSSLSNLSSDGKKAKYQKEKVQAEKIAKLYPKKIT
tara:strand:+ start:10338 stop:10559 length:222 start_codon:yes stop_codon:yes gene_type:complete